MSDGVVNPLKVVNEQIVNLYFINGDFTYKTNYINPRLDCGAFLECLKEVYKYSSKKELKYEICNKTDLFDNTKMNYIISDNINTFNNINKSKNFKFILTDNTITNNNNIDDINNNLLSIIDNIFKENNII